MDAIHVGSVEAYRKAVDSGVALVDFYADWCGPCQMQAPILSEVAEEVGTAAHILKVNVDEYPELASENGVQSIPTLILFNKGSAVKRFVGVQQKESLINEILTITGAAN